MEFFIWNKKDSVMGLSANVLLNSRVDFMHDDVIIIHKKGDKHNVVMMETAESLRETYDIESKDANVIGFVVSVILAQEDMQTVREMLKDLDEQNRAKAKEEESEVLDDYTKLLDDLLKAEIEKEMKDMEASNKNEVPFLAMKGSYMDPECNVIDLSDVEDDVTEKKLTVVLKHAFVSEEPDVTKLKCMEGVNNQIKDLEERREKAANESDFASVELLSKQIEAIENDISDACDATLKIEANKVYQYYNGVFVECTNGQTIILDGAVIETLKTNALEYEKCNGKLDSKYKVHYKTVDIRLSEFYNEIKERGNTLFVISV